MNKLQNFILTMPMGFLSAKDIAELIAIDRLFPVLVRCGGCRFTCAAQDVDHLCRCIVAGEDYVRDVSLPHGSTERAATWVESCPVTPLSSLPASFTAPRVPLMRCERGGHDGMHVYAGSNPVTGRRSCACGGEYFPVPFNENDCGGVYDGIGTVTSDADPGL